MENVQINTQDGNKKMGTQYSKDDKLQGSMGGQSSRLP
tara:strand:+ start:479 stop:592 length:114 start_codon:yes stop_codon:yes gene_type:complete